MNNSKVIAFYLPQFYPTKENDEWWEPGFTEWTNVARAKPLFKGHIQPRVPRDLGFYDLRVHSTREKQAELAKMAGIQGFCYWHYWFGNGKRLLSEVFQEVVDMGKPSFPFCLCWANHSWYKKTWDKSRSNKLLIEQTYPGVEDYTAHFYEMLPAFKDNRYMRNNGRLIFGVYAPLDIPNFIIFKNTWNNLAKQNGLEGFYFFGFTFKQNDINNILKCGYDSVVLDQVTFINHDRNVLSIILRNIKRRLFGYPNHASTYERYVNYALKNTPVSEFVHASVDPNFDHSPRSGNRGVILTNNSPKLWFKLLKGIKNKSEGRTNNLIFIKAWNEWGEGNYLEPDTTFGMEYINKTAEALK